jgi:hypothetical protein
MKIIKLFLMIGVSLLSTNCAYNYNKVYQIPMTPRLIKMDFGKPIPFEAGLLITEQTKNQVFQSQTLPDFINDGTYYDTLEPYQLPVGQAFENASLQIFSQIFQKIHLIRTREEGQKYPLIIEPKLSDFDFHLRYAEAYYYRGQYEEIIYGRAKAKISGTLLNQNRVIWLKSVVTPVKYGDWLSYYQVRENVGNLASETITQALEELAIKMVEDSRTQPRGWLEEIKPTGR